MIRKIKKLLYFFVANYFAFWAKIQLNIWKPKVIVITGSNGKTSTMHLVRSQLKNLAKYSDRANSAFGIPFDILGLERKTFSLSEWPMLLALAPFKAFHRPLSQKIYVAEADAERPGEGKGLSALLEPEITLWLNFSRTHSGSYDHLVKNGNFSNIDEAIADEFGSYLLHTQKLCIINADDKMIVEQSERSKAKKISISEKSLKSYAVTKAGTRFAIDNKVVSFSALLPKEFHYSISAVFILLRELQLTPDYSLNNFDLPAGRSSIFAGINNTTIIDSSYNANFGSVEAILRMYTLMESKSKWLVLGDLIEQGNEEAEEHAKLIGLINNSNVDKVILVGPRLKKYTYAGITKDKVAYENPKEALDYILANIVGGETLLFKGARFLEGIIEHLLQNKDDIAKLCRREEVWQNRRKKWGL